MRPHKLTISAFLAFGGKVEIDFDKLYERGLFLVFGETGAGKTSIFDAMAYAIYGQVPGSRSADKNETYRSLHAKPDTKTFVELDATVGGKRYLIRRNPEFLRPKVKGEGFAKENAKTLVSVWKNGSWEPLVGQHGSADAEILDWIKIKSDQFFKLVLLPQGEFAAFLKSKGKERSEILMNLFDVKTYRGIQKWFQDQESSLTKLVSTAEVEKEKLLSAVDQIVGNSDIDISNSSKITEVIEEYEHSIPLIENEVISLKDLFDKATIAFNLASERSKEIRNLRTARTEYEKAQEALQSFRIQIAELVSLENSDDQVKKALDHKRDELKAELQELNGKKERIKALSGKRQEISSLESDMRESHKDLMSSQEDIDAKLTSQGQLEGLRKRLGEASSEFTETERALNEISSIEREFEKVPKLRSQLSDLSSKVAEAKKREEEIQIELNDAFKLKLELQASELANALLPGSSCPVCGSTSHPNPVKRNPTIVSPDIEEIDTRRGSAKKNREILEEQLSQPRIELASIEDAISKFGINDNDSLQQEKTKRSAAFDVAKNQRDLAKSAQDEYEKLTTEITSARTKNASAKTRFDNAEARIPLVQNEIEEIEAFLAIQPGDTPTLPDTSELEKLVGSLDDWITKAGKIMGDFQSKEAILRNREREFQGDPDEIIDTEALGLQKSKSEKDWSVRNQELIDSKRIASELTEKKSSLIELEENIQGRKKQLERHQKMSIYMTGNAKPRVPLVNYYLAAKLEQVLQQANTRLREITDNRYTLLSNSTKTGRGQQSLALEVHDSWNGERRSTESLSGGETFVCSLALALGLADSTKQVTTLESLFIDEGFGTLDQNYLNNVMNSLDRLRSSSGRLVGLVSHVTELRTRIPTRIHVIKGDRGGSTIDPQY